MRGNTRGRRTNGASRLQRQITNLKHQINGVVTTPPADPGAFNVRPWNAYTFEVGGAALGASVSVQQVITSLVNNLGIAADSVVQLRILSGQIWGTAENVGQHPNIAATYHELESPTGVAPPRREIRDQGTLSIPARTGFVWPKADQTNVLDATSGSRTICQFTSPASIRYTMRLQILWKSTKKAE